MTVRVLSRSALHRQDNDAHVAGYGRTLRAVFDDWVRHSQAAGMSTQSLGGRLQAAAEASYEPAYLRGKRQAFSAAALDPGDRQWIAQALRSNRGYLQSSLEADVQDKAILQRMQRADFAELRQTFGSRIERQYGGQLWRVTEAGFRSGVRDLGDTLRQRFRVPLRQAGDDQGDDRTDEAALLAALALLLRLGRTRVQRVVARVGASVADLATTTSAATQEVAARLGVTPDALAGAASEAATAGMGDTSGLDEALADALGIGAPDLVDLGAALGSSAGAGFRLGTAYRTQNDGDVCLPCQEDAVGDTGDGVYWEPNEPPLPGDDCRGKGNCRCYLEAVYEFGGSDAAVA